ncbi:protein rep [Staphylococcus aureus]|uniref:protein rep n=2 Tax=Staphylococcaceae TaxID=90964 RepID=UPI00168025FC|nr:protein rep [Staphylococcus aureus]
MLKLYYKFNFATEPLNESLSYMTKAFRKLMMYKKVSKNLIGFMRATEITVNKENGSYNQHMHILLSVKSNFFLNKENYITQSEWTDLWQRALQVDYKPIVNIRAIKPNKKKDSAITSAIKETAKYSVKSSDYLTDDLESNLKAVEDLERGLYAKRLISYGGALKTAHKRLNLDDNEDGDLIHTSDDEISETESKANSIIAIFNYEKQDYYLKNE